MQGKDSSKSRGENARNEKRDSQGRFESTDKKDGRSTSSKAGSSTSSTRAQSDKKDSHSRSK